MIQFLFNLLSPIFCRIRYRKIANPFKKFREIGIKGNCPKNEESNEIILITPIRVSPSSNVFEGLLGTFMSVKGQNVKYLLCSQVLSFCENISNPRTRHITCSLCLKEQKNFLKSFGGSSIDINSFLTNNVVRTISSDVDHRSFIEDKDFIFNGVNLKDPILFGVLRITQKTDLDVSQDIKLVRECAKSAFLLSKLLMLISERYRIKKLITSHGIYSTWGAIEETAKYLNISSLVWGRGYIGQGNMLFGNNMAIQEDLTVETSSVFDGIVMDDEKKGVVFDYFLKKDNPKLKVDYVNYYKGILDDSYDMKGFEDTIKNYSTIFGMFTNIPWDGQVFNKTKDFPTTKSYLRNTIEWFIKNKDCLLVIRAHPAEATRTDKSKTAVSFEFLLRQEYPILPDNVIFLEPKHPITSYRLLKYIDYSIMYGSSMAIELAVRRIPVIQTGRTYISNKNIVFDSATVLDFYRFLDSAKHKTLKVSDDMYDNALKYGYYWIKYRNIFDTSCKLEDLSFVDFTFTDSAGFLEDRFLNFVYKSIINNKRLQLNN